TDGNYANTINWNPNTTPDSSGTGFFGQSSKTFISVNVLNNYVGGWTFLSGASDYVFIIPTSYATVFFGTGIAINGSSNVTVDNFGFLQFTNGSMAGRATIINEATSNYFNSSTAGSAAITNDKFLNFDDFSTAGNASITNFALIQFYLHSTAGAATITNN